MPSQANDQSTWPEFSKRKSPTIEGDDEEISATTAVNSAKSQVNTEPDQLKSDRASIDQHNQRLHSETATTISTDDDVSQVELEQGIRADIPIEALAGRGLVTNVLLGDEFDWGAADDDDDDDNKSNKDKADDAKPGILLCLNRNSSMIAWACVIAFAIILIAVDIALFVVYDSRPSMVSYNLQLWFTWAAFMWCISIILQIVIELVPWAIKRLVGYVRPQSSEVLRMRLAYYMALRTYIKLLTVSAFMWGTWVFLREHLTRVSDEPGYVDVFRKIWQSCFFAALMLFIEKFILQLIVTSFHKKAYGDRIRDNDRALKILDKLRKVKRKPRQEHLLDRIRRKGPKTKREATSDTPQRSNSTDLGSDGKTRSIMRPPEYEGSRGNVHFPSRAMDTLISIPPVGERASPEDDHKASDPDSEPEVTRRAAPKQDSPTDFVNSLTKRLKDIRKKERAAVSKPNASPPTVDSPPPLSRTNTWMSWRTDEKSIFGATRELGATTTAIPGRLIKEAHKKLKSQTYTVNAGNTGTSRQAKALAKRIYQNITRLSGRESIGEADLYPFFRTPQEAAEAFRLFDRDSSGDISKRELRSGCVRIYRERKNLSRSMRDLSQATGKLDIILLVIFTIIWIVIVLASFGVDVGTQLLPLWSAFIAASFVFGSSATDAFESIIFVFVTHPFDAGDRIFVGEENWVVENVGLLVSTFIKWDGSVVYVKNSVLSSLYIINCRRTGPTGEVVEINIAFSTPSWKIRQLQDHMCEWTNEFPALYEANQTSSNVISFENQNRITLSFYFVHTHNWQDAGGRWLRHNNFMMELKEECERLDINYVLPSQPLQNTRPNDAPPSAYNMGHNSGYGQQGMQLRRRGSTVDTDQHRGPDG